MKKTDLPGGWPPDLIGYRNVVTITFPLRAFHFLAKGMVMTVTDGGPREHLYRILHLDEAQGVAYGIRVPWYLCLRLTAANIGRWLLFHLRRLAWRKPPGLNEAEARKIEAECARMKRPKADPKP